MLTAITRAVSPAIVNCELTFLDRRPIDLHKAREQHRAYEQLLQNLGAKVIPLPAEPTLPDSMFVEDPAIVLDELAVILPLGTESRRPEAASLANALEKFRKLAHITARGSLEGGDVLHVDRTLYVGLSTRTNAEGIRQLAAILAPHNYKVVAVPVTGCLHLKSAVTLIADDTLLVHPGWVDRDAFPEFRVVEIDPDEPHAANTLRVGSGLIYPSCFPGTQERLSHAGIAVTTVDVSELQKAEGAVTCCSLIFEA